MLRAWLVVSRGLTVLMTVFPMWLGYAIPFVRMTRFGAEIPMERWRRLH